MFHTHTYDPGKWSNEHTIAVQRQSVIIGYVYFTTGSSTWLYKTPEQILADVNEVLRRTSNAGQSNDNRR